VAWPITVVRSVGYAWFLAVDALAAGLWAGLWVGLGWGAGSAWEAAAETAGKWMLIGGALTVALAAGAFALRWWRGRTAGTPEAP
jgi:membrane protein DedA with SNARE-associated domain